MKLNFAVCLVLSMSSWWQQPLRKSYSLWCQNGVMFSDSFATNNPKIFRQYALLVLRLTLSDLSAFVTELQGENRVWSKIMCKRALHEKLRENSIYYTDVVVDNWNWNQHNILLQESGTELNLQLDSRLLDLWNRRTSVEPERLLTVENYLDLP